MAIADNLYPDGGEAFCSTTTLHESIYSTPFISILAVIVALPRARATIFPSEYTVATLVSLLFQLTRAPLGVVVAERGCSSPTFIVKLEEDRRMPGETTVTRQVAV